MVQQPINLEFRPDIDAAGRFVEDQDPGVAQEPAGHQEFLLVAATEFGGQLFLVAATQPQRRNPARAGGSFLPALDPPAETAERAQVAQGDVTAKRQRQEQTLFLAILGEKRQPQPHGIPRRPDGHPATGIAQQYLTPVKPVGPK